MLPLTRNIFRQTATPFNNATKRWKQESYYVKIKWSSAAVCGSLKDLHVSINGTTLKVGSSRPEWVTSAGKERHEACDAVWWILYGRWCRVCVVRRCIWNLVGFLISFMLKHFLFVTTQRKKNKKTLRLMVWTEKGKCVCRNYHLVLVLISKGYGLCGEEHWRSHPSHTPVSGWASAAGFVQ